MGQWPLPSKIELKMDPFQNLSALFLCVFF